MDAQVEAFVKEYCAQWSPPSTSDQAAGLGNRIASYYRPGMTFFVNGNAMRLEVRHTHPSAIVTVSPTYVPDSRRRHWVDDRRDSRIF